MQGRRAQGMGLAVRGGIGVAINAVNGGVKKVAPTELGMRFGCQWAVGTWNEGLMDISAESMASKHLPVTLASY